MPFLFSFLSSGIDTKEYLYIYIHLLSVGINLNIC